MNKTKTKRILGFPDLFWIGFVIMVGFFLKLVYDIQAGWTITSHDLGVWLEEGWRPGGGVLGVIQYYYNMHRLPDIDPRTLTGYAGPPLYYMMVKLLKVPDFKFFVREDGTRELVCEIFGTRMD